MTTKWLVIDNTKTHPIQGVVEAGGRRVGNTSILSWDEVTAAARWLGINAPRRLLDAFELKLIEDGVIRLRPVDEDGNVYPGRCEPIEMVRHNTGTRIVWQQYTECDTCDGKGHTAPPTQEATDEDECLWCSGTGWASCCELETDMEGVVIAPADVDA
jgi:hypothetical protein